MKVRQDPPAANGISGTKGGERPRNHSEISGSYGYSLFSSFNSTRFHAIRLSKYNCSVRVEDEYHTEHGQAALRRDFNFDSPVTQ